MTSDSSQIGVRTLHASPQLLDCNDPLFVHPSDTPGIALVPQLLVETENYSEWSLSMKMSLLVMNKIGFIDGTCTREKYEADSFRLHQWDRCNAIVQPWIMSSVAQELRKGIVYSSNAKKVWEAFRERFDKVNATKVYHMNREISSLTQEISSVSIYYSRLNVLRAEFESIMPFPGCDCVKSREFVEFLRQQKLMKFLMGLNDTYAPKRSQILMMNPTPTIDQAYSMIIKEESQRLNSNLGVQSGILGSAPMDGGSSAMIPINTSNARNGRNWNLQCDYCHMKGYTKENCYKLIGYPTWPKFNNNNRRRRGYNGTPAVAHNENVKAQEEMYTTGTKGTGYTGGLASAPIFTHEQYQ
ncbi:uncharacterized protein LOC142175882 [Nicotiana tabacum]|uniref:Uncharacterized protein LOC142175882 n=1 Tax=Nicotiana tabacum TaxID=4097 RepID=A0AC58TP39_TOBAC